MDQWRQNCVPHTTHSLGHAVPALCREHVGLNDVLHGPCPSLLSLRRRLPFLVRLVHRYYGTVRLLLYVHVRRSVYGLRGPALIVQPRRAGDLPVLVHVVSQRARFSDYAGPNNHSRLAWLSCCLPPYRNGVGILILRLFEAQLARPTDTFVY